MRKSVLLLDGPVGVGKSSLGRAAASRLAFGFIDGDDCSEPGPWLRSILRTSRGIVAASQDLLRDHRAVIVAYPLRCTNWVFYHQTFARMGVRCRCIGLSADLDAIASRERVLGDGEMARSAEMIAQGYGRRPFSAATLRTDEADFDETCRRLVATVERVLPPAGS